MSQCGEPSSGCSLEGVLLFFGWVYTNIPDSNFKEPLVAYVSDLGHRTGLGARPDLLTEQATCAWA